MREAFALSHFFSTENVGVFELLTFEILRKRELTMSLVLNSLRLVSYRIYVF